MRLVEAFEPGGRVRLEPCRWGGEPDRHAHERSGATGTIVRLSGHSKDRLPNGTEEELYVVQLDNGRRTSVVTRSLVPANRSQHRGEEDARSSGQAKSDVGRGAGG
jgi:hypothetical protein